MKLLRPCLAAFPAQRIIICLATFLSTLTAGAQWQYNGNNIYYNNGGNVGINITAPVGPFQVYGGNAYLWGLNLGYGTSTAVITTDAGNKPIVFQLGGTEYARVNGNGAFGIGTNNPQNTLHVNGTVRADGALYPYSSLQGMGDNTSLVWDAYGAMRMGFTKKFGFGPKLTYGAGYTFAISESSAGDIGASNTFTDRLVIDPNGNVGIGTGAPQSLLAVKGNITAMVVTVTQTGWSDYVFAKEYKLPSLKFVEDYIQSNHHLPEIPSAEEIKKKGIDLGDNQALLLKKVEELTLYIIAQEKELETVKKELATSREQNSQRIDRLERLINDLERAKK
jgi:hypothetical protein